MKYYVNVCYGDTFWYKDAAMKKRHRVGGPAVEFGDGQKEWYKDGVRHRKDGPAVEYCNGYKAWYRYGKYQRNDGNAVEDVHGYRAWYINGEELTEEEISKLVQRFGDKGMSERIEKLSYYMKSHGAESKYKDHYATILAWSKKEENVPQKEEKKSFNDSLKFV